MKPLAVLRPFTFPSPSISPFQCKVNTRFRSSCSPIRSESIKVSSTASTPEYKPGLFDDFLLSFFRSRVVQELGWDSEKPGYDGLMELVTHLHMKGKRNSDTEETAVRILRTLLPNWLLELFKSLIAPIAGGRLAAIMSARATALSCRWLMGPCSVNSIDLPNGSSCRSGVFVERCKYLEGCKCVGICLNTCKLPTQTFFKDYMGVPLLMEPNFSDYSCQFKFGIHPLSSADDKAFKEPCLEICPNASRRRELGRNDEATECPQS